DEHAVERIEGETLGRHHRVVANVGRRAERRELFSKLGRCEPLAHGGRRVELRHTLDVDVDRISKQPTYRAVRADVAVAINERMEWVDAYEVGAAAGRPLAEMRQIGEVANAPIAIAAHGIEVGDQTKCVVGSKQ